jgi:cytochrome c oxidase assembly protein subunit 15
VDRARRPVSPEAYARITIVALVLLGFIVVTGAAVRLTGSGLGCTDWPNCNNQRLVASTGNTHAMVEFGNRLVTGAVSIAVALAVLGSLRRSPRRRDLVLLSWGLVGGVVAQILLGAVVVKSGLNPWFVQGHFVVSMVLVLDATVLAHRASLPDGRAVRPVVTPALLRWGRLLVASGAVVLATGTLVTGSGPHSGNKEAPAGASAAERLAVARQIRRLPLAVHDAARVHGIAMIVFLGLTLWVLVQIRRHHPGGMLARSTAHLLTVLLLQATVGYTQYFTGVPPLLVGLHVFGATVVWIAALRVVLRMKAPVDVDAMEPQADGLARSSGGIQYAGGRTGRDVLA